jgi:phosphoenolpyruvate-protein phosphotransferase (PTS system enzyme I)
VLERRAVVRVRDGLHARPATEFVKLARSFSANVEIACGGKSANAKSAVKLMLLGVKEADEIVLRADGPDAGEAIETLANFVAAEQAGELTPASEASTSHDPLASAPIHNEKVASSALMRGVPASEGSAMGPAFAFFPDALEAPRRTIAAGQIEAEIGRLNRAITAVRAELTERGTSAAGSEEALIVEALGEIACDPEYIERIETYIRGGQDAASATLEAGETLAGEFDGLADSYLRARSEDVRAVARQIVLALLGRKDASLSDAPAGAVILAEDISVFDLVGASLERIAGLVCIKGGATSHIAIIARAFGVPAVLGLEVEPTRLRAALSVALDGSVGDVAFDPDDATAARFRSQIESGAQRKAALQNYTKIEPRTRDGRLIEVAANIGSLKEIDAALAAGAMGVGLFRTELLFMQRKRPPSEDEQAEVYEKAATAFAPWPVVVRTLDIGGDKAAPGIEFPHEDNPFLGWRGVRMCLDRPDIFKPQLRALLRAATHGNLKVMAPMIAEVEEVRRVKRLLDECRAELAAEGVPYGAIALGIMIETPAAALLADELAREVAFFSIGTNDLTQYVMAADRLNPRVANLNRADHPAVLKAIKMTCDAARKAGIWVGICGEAAARPDLIPIFVEMGVSELSMGAASIPLAKKCITEI